jgi:hypothetical protein
MFARSRLLLVITLDMGLSGDSIYIAELKRLATPASYVSFVIKFSAMDQNMGPAQWANT